MKRKLAVLLAVLTATTVFASTASAATVSATTSGSKIDYSYTGLSSDTDRLIAQTVVKQVEHLALYELVFYDSSGAIPTVDASAASVGCTLASVGHVTCPVMSSSIGTVKLATRGSTAFDQNDHESAKFYDRQGIADRGVIHGSSSSETLLLDNAQGYIYPRTGSDSVGSRHPNARIRSNSDFNTDYYSCTTPGNLYGTTDFFDTVSGC